MIFDDPQHCSVAEIDVGRWVQWSLEWSVSTSRCIVTLRDVWFQKEENKSTVRMEFDEIFHERPPSIFVDSLKSNGNIVALCVCIAHFDGTIQRLVIESSDKCSSLLAPLMAMADADGGMGMVKISSLSSSASKDVKMVSALCGIAKNRIVSCVHWSSSKSLTLGLRGGDTVLVSLLEENRGSILPLAEFLFRDTFLLQVLWNGIMQTDNLEKATLGTFTLEMSSILGVTNKSAANRDDIVIAVSSEGVLRIWSTGSRRCTAQVSLAQLLNNMLAVEVLEDVVIRATVSPCEKVLQTAIALNFRNRRGGEKEWHICAMEINLADVSSSVIVDNGNRLRVTAVLSPPTSWSPLPHNAPRSPLPPPPPPALLDLQLYRSDAATVLLTAWKWNPPLSDDPGSLADSVPVPLTGLCSRLLAPSSSPSGITMRACMDLVEDSGIDSAVKRQALSAEDVTLCGQLVVRVDQPVGADCEALAVKQLQQAMIHRIFAPDRFSLRVVSSVLTSGVPVPYRTAAPQEASKGTDELLATCIQRVLDCCVRWSKSRDFGVAASGDSAHERELKCQARAFLRFIELCQRESDVTDCFTAACLQKPRYDAASTSASTVSTNLSDSSISVAVSRQSLAFSYLTIPLAAVVGKPSTVSISHSRAAGRAAMEAVSTALALQNDLCVEMDVTLQRTFREHAVLDCRNMCWLSVSISEMAAAVQSSVPSLAPAVLLHLQSALPLDFNTNTAQQGSSHGWLSDYLGNADEGEGEGVGSECRYNEPTAVMDNITTIAAAVTDNRNISLESREFLCAASRISRSKILCFYREARLKAVLLSVLSSSGGSLHCSLSSHVDRELLPQALFSVVYWGLLAWLGTAICADSDSIRDSVDLFDLFTTDSHSDGEAGTVYSHNGSTAGYASVWESFCSSISRTLALSSGSSGHLNTTVTHVLKSSRPGPTSALLAHLTRSMQQSGVSRVSSLMLWGAQCQGSSIGQNQRELVEGSHQSRISSLAEYVVKTRFATSLSLSSFLDCLRQLLRGQVDVEGDDDGSSPSSASLMKHHRSDLLSEKSHSCLEDLIAALKNPSASSDVDVGEEEMQTDAEDDLLVVFSEMLHSHGDGYADSSLTALQHRVTVLLRTSTAFSTLVKNIATSSALSEEALRVSVTSPVLFLHLHRIAHLTDIVEMTKRIRDITTRPGDTDSMHSGAGLAVRANYALADAIDEALSGISASAGSLQHDVSSVLLQLSAEQVVCWSSVFEHAVQQQSFDEALGAVTRLIEIEQSYDSLFAARVAKLLEGFGVSGWRSALGSLVLHACTSGRLGWLCSLNDTWVRGVHVTGEIAQELDQLASSGRSHSSVDGIVSTSYYECSCVYALSRQNLHKAARISVLQAQTLDLQCPDGHTPALAGAEQIRALSVAAVALAVIEPQHSAFVLVRSRAALAKNSRSHSPYDDSEEMMVEQLSQSQTLSDDPLTAHTVHQLSAALHLRLTAAHASASSSRERERGSERESKQSTALHLSVTLEELSRMNQLRGDFSAGPDASSDIIHRCCYPAVPPGQPSSSSGRSAVVYSLAADIVAEQRQRREGMRSSGADDRLHSMYSPQGGGGLSFSEGCKFDPHPWNQLLDILSHFDSPVENWDLHRSAIEGALKAGIQEVPHALVLSYWRAGGDMGALLRVLMEHGHLLEACALGACMVTAESPSLSIVSNPKIIVPYTILDKVIIASNKFISLLQSTSDISPDSQRQIEELACSIANLESALTKHFNSLLEAELR